MMFYYSKCMKPMTKTVTAKTPVGHCWRENVAKKGVNIRIKSSNGHKHHIK